MTTMTRTDIHRPSAAEFDPEAYVCIGVFDLNPDPLFGAGENKARMITVNRALDAGFRFAAHQSTAQCGHCGAFIRYAALMAHDASKDLIWIGETCLDNRFEALTATEFHKLREAAKLNKDRATRHDRFVTNLAAAVAVEPSLAVLGTDDFHKYGDFVVDVRSKLFKWELSERQITALAKTIAKQDAWAAQRAEEAKTAKPVPVTDKRFTVTGEIVSKKEVPDKFSRYGGTITKVVVKDDQGFRVYGTMPSALWESEKGDRIKFDAKVTASDDDETFGWFSRPTKAAKV